jgi:SAM-dependent methyltransferase
MTNTTPVLSRSSPSGLRRTFLAAALVALGSVGQASAQPTYIDEIPFVTSADNVTVEMLRIARVGPQDHLIDLGSGDGRIIIQAARRHGASGLGVEIVPDLVEKSLQSAREAGVASKVEFKVQDLFQTDLSKATVVTMYLLPEVNLRLRPQLLQLRPGTRIVSHDWDMAEWKPDETTTVPVPNKTVGREKSSKIHLWTVPAQIGGTWCGTGPLAEYRLELKQVFQEVDGTLTRRDRVREVRGRMQGDTLVTQQTKHGDLEAQLKDGMLRVNGGNGALTLLKGSLFRKAPDGKCPAA